MPEFLSRGVVHHKEVRCLIHRPCARRTFRGCGPNHRAGRERFRPAQAQDKPGLFGGPDDLRQHSQGGLLDTDVPTGSGHPEEPRCCRGLHGPSDRAGRRCQARRASLLPGHSRGERGRLLQLISGARAPVGQLEVPILNPAELLCRLRVGQHHHAGEQDAIPRGQATNVHTSTNGFRGLERFHHDPLPLASATRKRLRIGDSPKTVPARASFATTTPVPRSRRAHAAGFGLPDGRRMCHNRGMHLRPSPMLGWMLAGLMVCLSAGCQSTPPPSMPAVRGQRLRSMPTS